MPSPIDVTVVPTGVANMASVLTGLGRAGAAVRVTDDPEQVAKAARLVLPGVGAFAAGMASLRAAGLVDLLRRRVAQGRPTLAVCLGLQLLCDASDESPGVSGIGAVPARVERFNDSLRVPQMGWNTLASAPECRFLEDGWAYFANAYRLADVPEGWHGAVANYGGAFVAAMERGDVLACQFHPELSSDWGVQLIERWLKGVSSC